MESKKEMKPSYKEMLNGNCQWSKEHLGVSYLLSFHSYREPKYTDTSFDEGHEGIWCYYLMIPEEMFPHRWEDFKCNNEYCACGPAFEDLWWDSSITWASSEPYYNRKLNKVFDLAKVGCDYNHLWHREAGYPDTFESVDANAKRTVEDFIRKNQDRYIRCKWSGKYYKREDMYESVGGWFVGNDADIPEGYLKWKRKK